MRANQVDLIIIGGGITGAGIARDAAMRGLDVAVIDKGDFGSGTSSKSSRLVHGGLRYLELYDFGLVFEACSERRILLNIAPHLVHPRSFLFPIHRDGRVPRWKMAAGLWLYDILSLFRNVQRHQMLSKRALLRAEPRLRTRDLVGGARYWDAQCDDARLTLSTIRSAHGQGALAANYVRADELDRAGGEVRGVRLTDLTDGSNFTVNSRIVVNATGPWSDSFRKAAAPALRPTKGAHITVPRARIGNNEALLITSPIDGRVMFVIPWGDFTYVGTTDTYEKGDPAHAAASKDDVLYLLRSANYVFPDARLTNDDVVSAWAGFRPLLRPRDPLDPSSVSREHEILEDDGGLISIVGGKLTTYRKMAAELVDMVVQKLHERDGRTVPSRAPTHKEPLPGGESSELDVIARNLEDEGLGQAEAQHLAARYGTEAAAVTRLIQQNQELGTRAVPDRIDLKAELIHACRREMALTLCDLLIRRTHLFYEAEDQGREHVPDLARLVAAELGWDDEQLKAQIAAYDQEVEASQAYRAALAADNEDYF